MSCFSHIFLLTISHDSGELGIFKSARNRCTLKKEALYHHLYETSQELEEVLEEYIEFYNGYRPHRKLNMKTPIQYEAEFFSATEDK